MESISYGISFSVWKQWRTVLALSWEVMEMFVNLRFTAEKKKVITLFFTTSALYLLEHNSNTQI